MKEKELRFFIRKFLMEDAGFVPAHRKKEYYNALSKGIRAGRGEKVSDIDSSRGKNYFETADGEALQYLKLFESSYKELTGAGMTALDKKLDPNVATHKHATGLLTSLLNFAKNANDTNKEIITKKITFPKDVETIKNSYKNLDQRLKPKLIACLNQYQAFLNKIGNGLSTELGFLISNMQR